MTWDIYHLPKFRKWQNKAYSLHESQDVRFRYALHVSMPRRLVANGAQSPARTIRMSMNTQQNQVNACQWINWYPLLPGSLPR